jgi:4,4'-diaponeurosporenoate glycosyltransferase
MITPALICGLGIPAGFFLIRKIPVCPAARCHQAISLSIVIPARNEEVNLPRLLRSIAESTEHSPQVLVVDDVSTDGTAVVARNFGAIVIPSARLPIGWTGKTWACHQGALHATGDALLFLDADTYFVAGGLDRTIASWLDESDRGLALSLLPYHATKEAYEQLSLFFSILMAAGAGGFGVLASPQLFGQSLFISKDAYFAVGGHAAVRGFILENFRLAQLVRASGARILCVGGRGVLHMRMFPEGFRQMSDSWAKAFTGGAAASGGFVLGSSILWISALWSTALLLVWAGAGRNYLAVVYMFLALQLAWFARQLGNYRFLTCLLYPLPLAYCCVVFGRSAIHRIVGRKAVWRGREI